MRVLTITEGNGRMPDVLTASDERAGQHDGEHVD